MEAYFYVDPAFILERSGVVGVANEEVLALLLSLSLVLGMGPRGSHTIDKGST